MMLRNRESNGSRNTSPDSWQTGKGASANNSHRFGRPVAQSSLIEVGHALALLVSRDLEYVAG
jgi:hypothetical protein